MNQQVDFLKQTHIMWINIWKSAHSIKQMIVKGYEIVTIQFPTASR